MALVERWWLSTYASDIYSYLRVRERRRMEYRGQSPQLHCRRDLVRFIGEMCDKMHLCVAVHHLATHLLDFFMDEHDIELHQLEMLSLACLVVAAKAEGVDPLIPSNGEIVRLMHNAFTSTHLACMEMSVLVFFDWEVHHPTIATFLDFFALLAMFPSDMARCRDSPAQLLNLESSLKNYLSYFLDTALKDYSFIKMPASMVAAACVACSRMCLHLQPLWSPMLENVSKYKLEQLTPCIGRLLTDSLLRRWGHVTLQKELQECTLRQCPPVSRCSCLESSFGSCPGLAVPDPAWRTRSQQHIYFSRTTTTLCTGSPRNTAMQMLHCACFQTLLPATQTKTRRYVRSPTRNCFPSQAIELW
ncbi:cyclin-J isoform X3 [Ixodes scapularis]|nr:cyclin-J isoform X3 [Ixodes scapularis]XP_029846657.2 cyclin-J isoform X3 [Ixodes scapularis]XP_029846658.2 cyclin-J isoform X3 [Ixodes scapularis]XP_029846659.2 cyclin-J isoform X3 [Ixodes scapularis]XP_029846660.2 cyclin-J isoform X3 [Ixodes scapularis]